MESGILQELMVVPANTSEEGVAFYCTDSDDIYLQQQLEILTGNPVRLIKVPKEDLAVRMEKFQDGMDHLGGISEEFAFELLIDDGETEKVEVMKVVDQSSGPIVRLINNIITAALKKEVSDIHIECHESLVAVKYRIDGILYPATVDLDKSHHPALVARLKVMAELDIAEKRIPQDGRFKLRMGKRKVDFRISVMPGLYGENVVIRILDNTLNGSDGKNLTLEQLGYSEGQLESFLKAIRQPHGLVLVAGPTGSGKTTTLYTALQFLNTGNCKIITIEDPVEYQLPGIVQIPVNLKKGLTFAKGLRSILRHDPDKILVGEIRDLETAEIAIQSALTGHLVLSTVHANSAVDVLARLENIGVNMGIGLSAVNCIISQRLIRVNCPFCRTVTPVSDEKLRALDIHEGEILAGHGCIKCNYTGYLGRRMICEILEINDSIRNQINSSNKPSDIYKDLQLMDGISLQKSAYRLLRQGEVNLDEIARVTLS